MLKLFSFVVALFFFEVLSGKDIDDYLVGIKQEKILPKELSDDSFFDISRLSDTQHLHQTIYQILRPRVVGTEGHKYVHNFILKSLKELQWSVEIDTFYDNVPIFGQLQFRNIIAKLNPSAERFLVLSCHYDSKYMPKQNFVGASDSAVPCAMLINLAKVLQSKLEPFRSSRVSVMLIFFDGEEAFKEWGPKDSIYGARHLAKKWETEKFIDRIDILILLDLIGLPDAQFFSFFKNTDSWYSRLIIIEERLSDIGLLEQYVSSGIARNYPNRYFQPNSLRSSKIEDDHIPFLLRGVPVLHLIPIPFPSVWHTDDDSESAIDYVSTENIARIIRVFTMEYLLSHMDNTESNKIKR